MYETEYIIFCDESDKEGKFFSDFYGGLLVGASQFERINNELNQLTISLGIHDEIKWQKVSKFNLERYTKFVRHLFKEIELGNLKIRIMFMQKASIPLDNSEEFKKNRYYKLYYQFIKHGLRLASVPYSGTPVNMRLYIDELTFGTNSQIEEFRSFIHRLELDEIFQDNDFNSKISIKKENIAFVESKKHILLQSLDLILGSVPFKLNNKDKYRNPEQRKIPNRTKARIELFKEISSLIRSQQPHFNIGISTSIYGKTRQETFDCPYAHWLFVPKESEYDPTLTKGFQKKNPTFPK